MRKLIWLSFAVLAGLWTLTIWLLLRLTDWMLGAVAAASLPTGTQAQPAPPWAGPLLDGPWMPMLQQMLLDFARAANAVLPMAGGLSAVIGVAAWLFWGCIMLGLLLVAAGLHWLAGKKNRPRQ
ncbi:hypothetical protein [Bordetella genomosp. 12]|uniref:Uncharacterized protein n=1 Tax=Bordetella genomosp. 12 TaxID=463035 RepID=A0A261VCZ2_9BORD|nr:hypothetical protein [Bordetella genomosp. 12]OZI72008.1 hypothetical protein CAL22_19725 [Bordetella genomosp. 12]